MHKPAHYKNLLNKNLQTPIFYILFISALIFTSIFFYTWGNFRIGTDDFHFLHNLKDNGIIGATIKEYNNWNSRYLSNLLAFSSLKLYASTIPMLIAGVFYYVFAVFAIYRFIHSLFPQPNNNSSFLLFIFSVSAVSGLFYGSFKINETWFWLCTIHTYMLSSFALVLGSVSLIKQHPQWTDKLISAFCFLYIGGASGPLTLTTIMVLLILYGYSFYKPAGWVKRNKGQILLYLILIVSSFTLLYTAPGNRERESAFENVGIMWSILYNFKFGGIIVFKYLPPVLFPLLASSSVFMIFQKKSFITSKQFLIKTAIASVLCFCICYLHQLPITYKTQDVGAYRALFPISLYLFALFAYIWYQLSRVLTINNYKNTVVTILFTFFILFQALDLYKQTSTLNLYTAEYDKQINILQNSKGKKNITLEHLPSSGHLMPMGITEDSSFFTNEQIADFYEIEFIKTNSSNK